MKQKNKDTYNNYKNNLKTNKMTNLQDYKLDTIAFKHLGRDTARTMWMFGKDTQEVKDANATYEKYRDQFQNPKSEIQFNCAKAFIEAGVKFIKEVRLTTK